MSDYDRGKAKRIATRAMDALCTDSLVRLKEWLIVGKPVLMNGDIGGLEFG